MFHPPMQRHAGKYYGKYSGEVVQNEDTQHLGRLQVRVPSVLGEQLTVWARPCLPYGHFFIPPVGTKVWVEFEAGDTQYPLWVGTWYPSGATPPQAELTPPDNRVVHTQSGHLLELNDAEGTLTVTCASGATLTLDKNGGATLKNQEGSLLELNGHKARVVAMDIALDGTVSVTAGESATEPTLMGNAFKALWDVFMLHTHATAVGPSGPPIPPGQPLQPGLHLTTVVKVK